MSELPCPYGRRQVRALALMNLRAVLTPSEVVYLARPVAEVGSGAGAGSVPARFRPRDGAGRFVAFGSLRAAIGFEYFLTESEYEEAEWGVDCGDGCRDRCDGDCSGVDRGPSRAGEPEGQLEDWFWD